MNQRLNQTNASSSLPANEWPTQASALKELHYKQHEAVAQVADQLFRTQEAKEPLLWLLFVNGYGLICGRTCVESSRQAFDLFGKPSLRRIRQERHAVVARFDHRPVVVGDLPIDLAANGLQRLAQADLSVLQAEPIHDDFDLLGQRFLLIKELQHSHDISEARQVQLSDEQDRVRSFHRRDVESVERLAHVDHEMSERRLQQSDDSPQFVGRKRRADLHVNGPRQQEGSAIMLRQ